MCVCGEGAVAQDAVASFPGPLKLHVQAGNETGDKARGRVCIQTPWKTHK